MKKGKKDQGKQSQQEPENALCEELVQKRPYVDNFVMADTVLNDVLLDRVARKMWEKELISKFQHKYLIGATRESMAKMVGHTNDVRVDDRLVTPRAPPEKQHKRPNRDLWSRLSVESVLAMKQFKPRQYEVNEPVSFESKILTSIGGSTPGQLRC